MTEMDLVANTFKLAASRHFSASELYASLARQIAGDSQLLAIARHARTGSFPPFLFFTAVHSILLKNRDRELARFFQTVSRNPPPAHDPYPALRNFALKNSEEITSLIQSANVNKSVINRSACLRALILKAAAEMKLRRIHLVDIGCGAGFNLLLDRWRIDYSGLGSVGPPDSPVQFSIRLQGEGVPPILEMPAIISRTGIDLDRFDLRNDAHVRWLQGGLFPEQLEIREVQERALDVLRQEKPTIVQGDAVAELPAVLGKLPGTDPVIVSHSLMLHQLNFNQRRSLFRTLKQAAMDRPVVRIGMELGKPNCMLVMADGNGTEPVFVGEADDDAGWMRWY